MSSPVLYRFGLFELDLRRRQLRREGVLVPLQEQPMRLLLALVESRGALVERETLRELLWGPGVHVDHAAGIHAAVRRVREALGDDADSPRYVQTLPRSGYRFLAPVEAVAVELPAVAQSATDEPVRHPPRYRLGWTGAGWMLAGLLAALLLVLWASRLPRRTPSSGESPRQPAARVVDRTGSETAVLTHFERARHFADRRSEEGLVKAIAEYQSGLALAPARNALRAAGYGGLASCYVMLGYYDYWRPTEAFEPARRMAERALAIDPGSAPGHLAMSLVHAVSDWDWATAEAAVDRAVGGDPDLAVARLWRAVLRSNLSRHEEALTELDHALAEEPVNPVFHTARGWLLFVARRGDEAVEQSRRTLALAPAYYDAWDNLKWFHFTRGELPQAARAWARAEELDGGDGKALLAAYQSHGYPHLLRESVASKLGAQRRGYSSPYDLALDYAALGEIEPALDQLERSHAEHETDLLSLAVDPRLDRLRDEPRFRVLLERMNLSDGAARSPATVRSGAE